MRNWGRPLWVIGIFLLVLMISHGPAAADPLTLRGAWHYQNADEGPETVTQLYGLTLSHAVGLTEVTDVSANFRYNRNVLTEEMREVFAPGVNLTVRNDIFRFGLSGVATEQINSNNADLSSRAVSAVWSSSWQKRLWPSLRLNLNKNWIRDDLMPHSQDRESWHGGLNTAWDFERGKVFYNFNNSVSDDHVGDSQSENRSHFVRFETAGRFLNDRASIAFSQQYSLHENETTARTGAGGFALIKYTPDPTVAAEVGLNIATLNWADLSSPLPPPTPLVDTRYHIGMDVSALQDIDAIYLYTSEKLTTAQWQSFNWALYSNTSLAGVFPWTPEAAPSINYNNVLDRFEIVFPATLTNRRYLALEELTFPVAPVGLTFTAVEVYRKVTSAGPTASSESDTSNLKSDVNIAYRMSDTMSVSYGLIVESRAASLGSDSDRRSQTGSLNWRPNRYLSSTFSIGEVLEERESTADLLNRTYALGISSPPLPTVDVGLGIARTESYVGGGRTSTSHSFSLTTSAALYRDLSSRFDLSYNLSDNEAAAASSESYQAHLIFTARMTPKLTITLGQDFTGTVGQASSDIYDTDLSMNWRPSDILSVHSGGSWEVQGDNEAWQGNLGLSLAVTSKMQMSWGYSYSYADFQQTNHNYALNFSWNINRYFLFNVGGQYRETGGEDSWNVNGRFSASFVGR